MKRTIDDEWTVIDFGAHFFPEELEASARPGEGEYIGLDRLHDPETVLAEMATAGVDAMVLSIPGYLGHDDAEEAREANDVLLEYVQRYDEFYGLAALPTGADGETAAAEFERSLDAGYHGAGLNESAIGLTDRSMEPVLEVADRTGAPVFVHIPSLPDVDYRLNAIFGREVGQQESITSVIHDGIYDRYPDLNLVWHHLGGNIASMLGRVHLHVDAGRWPKQEAMKPYDEFKRQFESRVYVDTSGFFGYTAPIRIALEEFPSTQLVFGTDHPAEPRSGDELGSLVNAILESGTVRDAQRILGENALDLLVNTD